MFWAEVWKISEVLSIFFFFHLFYGKWSEYLNRLICVMSAWNNYTFLAKKYYLVSFLPSLQWEHHCDFLWTFFHTNALQKWVYFKVLDFLQIILTALSPLKVHLFHFIYDIDRLSRHAHQYTPSTVYGICLKSIITRPYSSWWEWRNLYILCLLSSRCFSKFRYVSLSYNIVSVLYFLGECT